MRSPLQFKLVTSEIPQEAHQVALNILGPAASLYVGDPDAAEKRQMGPRLHVYLHEHNLRR